MGGICGHLCAKGRKLTSNFEKLLLSKKNGGALNFGSTPHRYLMRRKAQVKAANYALRLCNDSVGEKISLVDHH
jgi:hypothetical protein